MTSRPSIVVAYPLLLPLAILAASSVPLLPCTGAFVSPPSASHHHSRIASAAARSRASSSWSPSSLSRLSAAPEPLGSEGDWTAYNDPTTGTVYYFNGKTGASLWQPPTDTFPSVGGDEDPVEDGGGIFGGWFGAKAEEEPAAAVVEPEPEPEPAPVSLFGNLFGGGATAKSEPAAAAVKSAPAPSPAPAPVVAVVKEKKDVLVVATKEKKETAAEDAVSDKSYRPAFSSRVDDMLAQFKPKKEIIEIPDVPPFTVEMGSLVMPHPDKISWGGEDAVWSDGVTFGVFDGVSGAEKIDGIPLYSRTLAELMPSNLPPDADTGVTTDNLVAALQACADTADGSATGASTALVASVGKDGTLRALCVGDSSLLVVREGEVAARTKDVVHYFDCPYQLSLDSPDTAKEGSRLKFALEPGDVVVAGSDGVFDNVADGDIAAIVVARLDAKPTKKEGRWTDTTAKAISDVAREVSLDDFAPTPYSAASKKNKQPGYEDGVGGKVDDISCTVVRCL